MRKTTRAAYPAMLVLLCFLCFPIRTRASEIKLERAACFSITDETAALATLESTYQELLPDGKTAGKFTATITSPLTNSTLCEYFYLFRQLQEQNGYGGALNYKTTLSIAGTDAEGNSYSFDNVTTTEPISLTLAIPEYLRHRPNRVFMLFVKDASGKVIELGRGTETITFATDFSYVWYYVAYADERSTERIDFTVAKPVPGERVGDPKYRPQTDSTLCDWDNNVEYTVPYRYNHYRWSSVNPETGDGYYLDENDVFEEGKHYWLSMTFFISGNNPDVYINGNTPSWDIRTESGSWGEFVISDLDKKEETEQTEAKPNTAAPVSAPAQQHIHRDSDYEWNTVQTATETTDGEMRYQCRTCGEVKYAVPISAYYQFNANTVDKIRNAKQGATVSIDTPVFVSFHEMIKDELAARPDISLVVNYEYKGSRYQMLIPAGSAEKMSELFGTSKFCGFRSMAGTFATVNR